MIDRDKIAELMIMVAVEWIATPGYREWWHAGEDKKARSSTVECPECGSEVDMRTAARRNMVPAKPLTPDNQVRW